MDPDGGGEAMMDNTNCRNNGLHRIFCCPAAQRQPKCGWFDHNNGRCGATWSSRCPPSGHLGVGNWAEIGSYSGACSSSSDFRYQVACCSTSNGVDSTGLYGMCDWRGHAPDCANRFSFNECEGYGRTSLQTLAWSGSGAHNCIVGSSYARIRNDRPYCCDPPQDNRKWQYCGWMNLKKHDDGFCESHCPDGTARLAMIGADRHDLRSQGCNSGALTYCCHGEYWTETNDDEEKQRFAAALRTVKQNQGHCSGVTSFLRPREVQSENSSEEHHALLNPRQDSVLAACRVVSDKIQYLASLRGLGTNLGQKLGTAWNEEIRSDFQYLSTEYITQDRFDGIERQQRSRADTEARNFEDNLDLENKYASYSGQDDISPCGTNGKLVVQAFVDEDDGGVDEGPNFSYYYGEGPPGEEDAVFTLATRHHQKDPNAARTAGNDATDQEGGSCSRAADRRIEHSDDLDDEDEDEDENRYSALEERADQTGEPRTFFSKRISNKEVSMMSSKYPNGDQGDQLLRLTRNSNRYMIKWKGSETRIPLIISCDLHEYELNPAADKVDVNWLFVTPTSWVTEHIMELQTIPRFADFLMDGSLPSVKEGDTGIGYRFLGVKTDPQDLKRYLSRGDWNEWIARFHGKSPLDHMLSLLGSSDHVDPMVVCESDLNGVKARLYHSNRPVSNNRWRATCMQKSYHSARQALSWLSLSLGVFDYYDHPDVKARHMAAFTAVRMAIREWYDAYRREKRMTGGDRDNFELLWKAYMINHFERVVQWTNWWVQDRITTIKPMWDTECDNAKMANNAEKERVACAASRVLTSYQARRVTFTYAIFN